MLFICLSFSITKTSGNGGIFFSRIFRQSFFAKTYAKKISRPATARTASTLPAGTAPSTAAIDRLISSLPLPIQFKPVRRCIRSRPAAASTEYQQHHKHQAARRVHQRGEKPFRVEPDRLPRDEANLLMPHSRVCTAGHRERRYRGIPPARIKHASAHRSLPDQRSIHRSRVLRNPSHPLHMARGNDVPMKTIICYFHKVNTLYPGGTSGWRWQDRIFPPSRMRTRISPQWLVGLFLPFRAPEDYGWQVDRGGGFLLSRYAALAGFGRIHPSASCAQAIACRWPTTGQRCRPGKTKRAHSAIGGMHESRATRCGVTAVVTVDVAPSWASSNAAAWRPTSRTGRRMVLSAGHNCEASGLSS